MRSWEFGPHLREFFPMSSLKFYWEIIIRKRRRSARWLKDKEFKGIIILEYEGWDYFNFNKSWKEKITREEFWNRILNSSCQMSNKFRLGFNKGPIVKTKYDKSDSK